MSTEPTPIKRMFRYFLAVGVPVAVLVSLLLSWEVGLLFGALAGVFASMHMGRSLTTESFEINSSNKDPLKGLSWYEEEIIAHMRDLRYILKVNEPGLKIWEPRVRMQVMGGEVRMEVTPYAITIEGPRGEVRIIKSILDLNKIFL